MDARERQENGEDATHGYVSVEVREGGSMRRTAGTAHEPPCSIARSTSRLSTRRRYRNLALNSVASSATAASMAPRNAKNRGSRWNR